MARQSTAPVQFTQSKRKDTSILMTSARAGVVVPIGSFPLLAGDSASGRVGIDVQLKEMPKPLLNGVTANFQAWFVPKSCHPQFPGRDEFDHARSGLPIKSLGFADRTAPPFFTTIASASVVSTVAASDFFKTLGIHVPAGSPINSDLIDAFSLIYNFRLAAHSTRLTRRFYASENLAAACTLPPAFWPSSRFSSVVPDYETSLIVGSLDLDVLAGRLPISGITRNATPAAIGNAAAFMGSSTTSVNINQSTQNITINNALFAEMAGQTIGVTLADIDKARTTQAFAKIRSAYAGNDTNGFDNDDTIVALLMQGISVPADEFKRPWLLDSSRVPIGFAERFATDGANLDASVTLGRASGVLSINVPQNDVGGTVIFTVEVLPERIDERMSDEFLLATTYAQLPNALRDVQRTEPVDLVLNRRVDSKHTTPSGLYGYEPMNDKWNRDFTRLGGDFYQATPGAGWTENRSAIWQTEIVNPTFSSTHYLAPAPFPHDVFANQLGHAFEVTCRHAVTIIGLTQIGDVLQENNADFAAVVGAQA